MSRFCVAIPALLFDNCRVGQSIFRSDAYTEGEWLILAALLAKSVVGGYIASWLPFWFAAAVLQDVAVPSWFHWVLTASSIPAVSIVEPTMFIGFTLLYLQKRTATTDQPSPSEAQLGQALA